MSSQLLHAEAVGQAGQVADVPMREPDVITRSVSELHRRNPDIPDKLIEDLVQGAYQRLTPAKVRTYLPILIVREVSEKLRTRQNA